MSLPPKRRFTLTRDNDTIRKTPRRAINKKNRFRSSNDLQIRRGIEKSAFRCVCVAFTIPRNDNFAEATVLHRREVILGGSIASAGVLLGLPGCAGVSDVTFANPAPVWWNAVPLVATRHDFYTRQNVNILGFDVPTGVRSKQAIVDGNAQMGVASPNAISTSTDSQLARIRILGTVTQSRSTVAILSRRPPDQLNQWRIGYVKGTISEFYLIAYLMRTGQIDAYRQRRLQLVDLPPPNLVTAFSRGDIDAAVAWEPFASQIQLLDRSGIHAIRDESLYMQHIFILAASDMPTALRDKVTNALNDAARFIEQNRASVATELEQYFRFPAGFLTRGGVWDKVQFRPGRERGPIREALERDNALAREAGVSRTMGGAAYDTLLDQLS